MYRAISFCEIASKQNNTTNAIIFLNNCKFFSFKINYNLHVVLIKMRYIILFARKIKYCR